MSLTAHERFEGDYGDVKDIIHVSRKESQYYSLCANAITPFVLDGKSWQSVTHYMSAKRFEGTEYEETIRKATLARIPSLMIPHVRMDTRDNIPLTSIRTYVYGDGSYIPIHLSTKSRERLLYEANKAKITQNAKLYSLLMGPATTMSIIHDVTTPSNGKMLMRLRETWRKLGIFTCTTSLDFSVDIRGTRNIRPGEKALMKGITRLFKKIRTAEYADAVYSEMAEDVIYNLFDDEYSSKQMLRLCQTFARENMKNDYTDKKNTKFFYQHYKSIYTSISETEPVEYYILMLVGATKWYRDMSSVRSRERVHSTLEKLKDGVSVRILPIHRAYRGAPTIDEALTVDPCEGDMYCISGDEATANKDELVKLGGTYNDAHKRMEFTNKVYQQYRKLLTSLGCCNVADAPVHIETVDAAADAVKEDDQEAELEAELEEAPEKAHEEAPEKAPEEAP